MKAADFDYVRVATIDEACTALARANGEGKVIAGGQTLVPMMAMRLARPALLVDINDVAPLQGIARDGDALVIKACTRQADALASAAMREHLPLLAKAIRFVGHVQTRNRGTVGGSICHADPSAEIPLTALTVDAALVARSAKGERRIAIDDFFVGPMMTTLQPDECLSEVRFPVWNGGRVGTGFQEVSARISDFAIVSVAAQVVLDRGGICTRAAVAVGGAGARPVRCDPAAQAVVGSRLDAATIAKAAAMIPDLIEPDSDLHATADYRRRVARALVERALTEAAADAAERA
jgi:CO/xanthine dehydrogenase FAD-binding subunit